jgi:hypothetical protein
MRSNTATGASTIADAGGSAIFDLFSDGSQTCHVVGPVLARFKDGAANIPRGVWTINGIYDVHLSPTGFKTVTIFRGGVHDVCADPDQLSAAGELFGLVCGNRRGHGEELTRLALEHIAQRGQGGEPHRPGPAVLEHRQVGQRDPDLLGQFGEGQAPTSQHFIDVYLHPVLLGGQQITVSSSAYISPAWASTSRTASRAQPISPRSAASCHCSTVGE